MCLCSSLFFNFFPTIYACVCVCVNCEYLHFHVHAVRLKKVYLSFLSIYLPPLPPPYRHHHYHDRYHNHHWPSHQNIPKLQHYRNRCVLLHRHIYPRDMYQSLHFRLFFRHQFEVLIAEPVVKIKYFKRKKKK